jgi:hypothetical protein
MLGLDLNETGYLHSKRRDSCWPVCSFAFKSMVYNFHLRISPLKSATGKSPAVCAIPRRYGP